MDPASTSFRDPRHLQQMMPGYVQLPADGAYLVPRDIARAQMNNVTVPVVLILMPRSAVADDGDLQISGELSWLYRQGCGNLD